MIADVWTLAYTLSDAISAISDGVIAEITILYRWRDYTPAEAPSSSNVERKVLFLVTNLDGDINGVIIPSPIDIWEITGSYAGIRVDLLHASVIALQEALEAQDYRTNDDRQLGQVVAAGGLAL